MSRFNILEADLETQKPAAEKKVEAKPKQAEKKVEAKPQEKKAEAKQEKPQEKKQAPAPAAAPKQQAPTKTSSGLTIVRKGEAKEDGEFQKVDHSANPRKHIQRETVVPREGKRQYERRDGTGRAHEGDKKQGAGKGNWGKPEDASIKDAPIDDKEVKEVAAKPVEPVEPEEPPKKTMEEYLAEQKSAKPKGIKAPKMRVANEGEKNLDKKWGETIELKNPDLPKKAEEKKAEEKKTEEKKEKKEEKKVAVPIEKVFSVVSKPVHEDRPRRYDNKEEKPQQQHAPKQQTKALELTNAADFPALPGGKK